jgi:lysophospholipase L1-like esterase
MKRLALVAAPALLFAFAPASPAAAAPATLPDRFEAPVYLALGDSIPEGNRGEGYPDTLAPALTNYNAAANKATPRKRTAFDLENIAIGGATTVSLIAQQLTPALQLIEARRADRDPFNDVEVITVTIGGNDLFNPVVGACILAVNNCQGVVDAQLDQVATNLTRILTELADAAGRGTEIVVTTYANSVRYCPLAGVPGAVEVAEAVLEGGTAPTRGLTVDAGLNDIIRAAAASAGVQVVDLYGQLDATQFVGDCTHPNAAGHAEYTNLIYGQLAR